MKVALVIGVAVVTGFLVQFLAWCLLAIAEAGGAAALPDTLPEPRFGIVAWLATIVIVVLPLSGVGYGLYRYFTWVGADQGTVTVAFVGGLLVKTFVIPLIKGIVTGAAFKVLMNWLRGGKKKGT